MNAQSALTAATRDGGLERIVAVFHGGGAPAYGVERSHSSRARYLIAFVPPWRKSAAAL